MMNSIHKISKKLIGSLTIVFIIVFGILIISFFVPEGYKAIDYACKINEKFTLDEAVEYDNKSIVYRLKYKGGGSRIPDCILLARAFEEYLLNNPDYYFNDDWIVTFSLLDLQTGCASFTLSNACPLDNTIHDKFDVLNIIGDVGVAFCEADYSVLSDIKFLTLQNDSFEFLLRKIDSYFSELKYLKCKCSDEMKKHLEQLYPRILIEQYL